ncbi:MAG: A/G-specific adenine glycosylase [Chloroflexi bacterium]|nr:MAG: A/G-specific adenine glycosylase [Chloroflexota bacterium]
MPRSLTADARVAVLAWYDDHGRSLAFRASRDPYAILVSEVMAQQTQVGRVVEAWSRFIARFPTVDALAAATPADVLRAWQGMGYDRRALNLRRAAQAIRDDHDGRVPDDVEALERLSGVGPYTARAVAAIAFGRPVGAVDTNIRRVLRRALTGSDDPPASAWMQAAANASVDRFRPAAWTHALMDLGATVCRPADPACAACPIATWCRFASNPTNARRVTRGARPSKARPSRPAFTATTRWLRGRILDRLRAALDGSWTRVIGPVGVHDAEAVAAALRALARDGLVELDPADPRLARLATT